MPRGIEFRVGGVDLLFRLKVELFVELLARAQSDLLNLDGVINAKDAATVLIAAARLGTGGATGFTDEQAISADVNNDGAINAKDANIILLYAAAVGTGNATNIKDYI